MNRALFLDRDGVINIDFGYVCQPRECVFVDGIFEVVRVANAHDYKVIIVTNQAGIGRGRFSAWQFTTLTTWMVGRFAREEATIDAVYHCPHHPDSGIGLYRIRCDCRKPQPGMLIRARCDFDLNMAESLIVGDKISDLEAGERAGVGAGFLLGVKSSENRVLLPGGYRTISNLLEVKSFLQKGSAARKIQ